MTKGLTIQTNLFGTTYYSLVGLHAFHVTVGLLALATVCFSRSSGMSGRSTPNASRFCRCIGTSWMSSGWWFSPSSTLSGAEEGKEWLSNH